MKITEVTQAGFEPALVEFWKQSTPQDLQYYFIQDNCYQASVALAEFLEEKYRIGNAEIIPIGRMSQGKKTGGWIHTDEPDLHIDALETQDKLAMKSMGLNPRSKQDRARYINSDPAIRESFCWVPHSWVEVRSTILDPSGFYLYGHRGQFDRMVHDKSNVSSRYKYF